MKTILRTAILLALPLLLKGQVADTVFPTSFWRLPTIGGLQCDFNFYSIEIEKPMFNPHGYDWVSYLYESEYQIVNGDGIIVETHQTTVFAGTSMNFENTAYSPDTIEVLGYFWRRVDAVDFNVLPKWKDSQGGITISAMQADVSKIACGCYKRIGRAKVVIDWIRKEPVKIARA